MEVDITMPFHKAVWPSGSICRKGVQILFFRSPDLPVIRLPRQVSPIYMEQCFVKQRFQGLAFQGSDGKILASILGTHCGKRSKYHFQIGKEVLVYCKSFRCLSHLCPFRFRLLHVFPLLQEHNVRHNAGSGIGFKRIIREPHRP